LSSFSAPFLPSSLPPSLPPSLLPLNSLSALPRRFQHAGRLPSSNSSIREGGRVGGREGGREGTGKGPPAVGGGTAGSGGRVR
jgi:hypothetical protein